MESYEHKQGRLLFEALNHDPREPGQTFGDLTEKERQAYVAAAKAAEGRFKDRHRLRDVTAVLLAEQSAHNGADGVTRSARLAAQVMAMLAGMDDEQVSAIAHDEGINYFDGTALIPVQTGFFALRLATTDPTIRFLVVSEDGGVCGDAIVAHSVMVMQLGRAEANRAIHDQIQAVITKVLSGEITPVNHDGDRIEFIHDSVADQIRKG